MTTVAIVGAGPIGGTLASMLALGERCARVVLIDEEAPEVAAGKALDIQQSCPVAGSDTRVRSSGSVDGAGGADALVIADGGRDGLEIGDERGLALVRRAHAQSPSAPLVLAGGSHAWLIERAVVELRRPPASVLGSAPLALEGAVNAIVALEADCPVSDVRVTVAGRPPADVAVLWDSAVVAGAAAAGSLDAAAVRRIEARLPALWPPAPHALAAAAVRVVSLLLGGTGGTATCFVLRDGLGSPACLPIAVRRSGDVVWRDLPAAGRLLTRR
jgi:hypothetical protein